MSIKDLHDWTRRAGLIPAGSHLQELVDAIRELQHQIDQFSDPEEFQPQERFLAVITNGPSDDYAYNAAKNGGTGSDWTDYRYWVKRALILGSEPNALAAAAYDVMDEKVPNTIDVYTAINLPEMVIQDGNESTHSLPANETFVVEVFGWWDVGSPQNKHYFFSATPAIAWIKVTKPQDPTVTGPPPTGGGGFYEGRLLTGVPVTIDPTTNLVVPQNPTEAIPSTNTIICENIAEWSAGNPPSHWVKCPDYFPAWYIGMSNEATPRPVYRFCSPRPGPQILIVSGNTQNSLGSGRYFANPLIGSGVNVNSTTSFLSPGTPDPGTAVGAATYVFCNTPESGAGLSATQWLIGGDPSYGGTLKFMAMAVFQGMVSLTGQLYPMFYGTALPNFSLFPVLLTQSGGDDGNSTTAVSYTYTATICDGLVPFNVPGGIAFSNPIVLEPLNRGLPLAYRKQSFYPAYFGLGGYAPGGAFYLAWAYEVPVGIYYPATPANFAGSPTSMTQKQYNDRVADAVVGLLGTPIP